MPQPRVVCHVIHITTCEFREADSLCDELRLHRDLSQVWCGLTLSHGPEIAVRGKGVFASFYDPNYNNDLPDRIRADEIYSDSRISEFGIFLESNIPTAMRRDYEHKEISFARKAKAAVA